MEGRVVSLSGPSGVGKTTIIRLLTGNGKNYCKVLPFTTRPPREYEKNGVDYWFLTPGEMAIHLGQDDTLRDSLVSFGGHQYAFSYWEIEGLLRAEQLCLIELYPDNIPVLRERFGEKLISIFVKPTSIDVLAFRLREFRSHDEAFIADRLRQAQRELRKIDGPFRENFNSIAVNNFSLEELASQFDRLIRSLVIDSGSKA
jgi:guanylate kinase